MEEDCSALSLILPGYSIGEMLNKKRNGGGVRNIERPGWDYKAFRIEFFHRTNRSTNVIPGG